MQAGCGGDQERLPAGVGTQACVPARCSSEHVVPGVTLGVLVPSSGRHACWSLLCPLPLEGLKGRIQLPGTLDVGQYPKHEGVAERLDCAGEADSQPGTTPPQHAGIPLKAQGGLSAMPSDPSQALLVGLERYRPHTSPVRWVNPPRPRSADGRLRLREVE